MPVANCMQGETGAQILVAPPLVPFLEGALTQVHTVFGWADLAAVGCLQELNTYVY